MPKKKEAVIANVTADNLDAKVIEKLELKKNHSYLLLFKVGTIPFEQAKNIAELLVDAGFKALFVAVQDTKGITVIEKEDEVQKPVEKAKKTFKKKM